MEKTLAMSDLVTCRTTYPFAHQLAVAEEIGIILDFRRDTCRVFYERLFQSFWLPTEFLRKVRDSEAVGLPLLQRLRHLLRLVGASECEFERQGNDYRLSAYVDDLPGVTLDEVRRYLDVSLLNFAIHPFGMSKMILELDFTMGDSSE